MIDQPSARTIPSSRRDLFLEAAGGSRVCLARLISLVEREGGVAASAPSQLDGHRGHSYVVGITGAPGAGKSTLTDKVIAGLRNEGDEVAVLAIDPSSPYSGGAILGDRVRMQEHSGDAGVYIRSLATRGHLGGLSIAVPEAARVLELVGFPWVLIETVGVGQVEVEIVGAADTTVVVVNPGWGDSVQANKAGLMEIADLFVINKSDRPGTRETRRDIESMLDLGAHRAWRPPIVETVGLDGRGIDELIEAIQRHREYLEESGELQMRRSGRLVAEFERHLHLLLRRHLLDIDHGSAILDQVRSGFLDPQDAATQVVERFIAPLA